MPVCNRYIITDLSNLKDKLKGQQLMVLTTTSICCVSDTVCMNSHLADCKLRVTQYVVPFVTHARTKKTKLVVVGQVQGYDISSIIFCDRK